MMSLRQASQRLNSRSPRFLCSYVEIPPFVRTRYHGISLRTPAARLQTPARSIGTIIRPDSKAKEALDSYRTTCKGSNNRSVTVLFID
jgi:aspartyl-tRNA synthetase